MDDVRIGIVGLGNMGTLTADFIYAGDVEHCVIGAICDIREERILYAKKHFTHLSEDCFYKDFRKMIAEAMIDAVYIAVPHYLHQPVATEAFAHGLHVITEKPAALSLADAQEMYEACLPVFDTADAAILSAAVADFTPEQKAESKIKREADDLVLRLRPTHDIAKTLGQRKRPGQRLVCFALETNDEEANARGKLERKNADFVVLNSTRIPGTTFNADDNQIAVVTRDGVRSYPKKSKQEVASDIIDVLQGLLADTTTLR